ncbi:apolipoprotein N-acyltransferase [Pseudomonas silvicola]|nr:apolipoprotein N-acyltransferase [Pseudomonas silvicola]
MFPITCRPCNGYLLALAAGALMPLALAPFNLWPLALLSAALFYHGLKTLPARLAFRQGWCYGFGSFGAGTSWVYVSIRDFGDAPLPLALALTVGFCAGLALLFAVHAYLWARYFRRDQAPVADALAFAALWLAMEVLRSVLLGGFPWLLLGYSQLDGPLAALAPLGGVWLISAALALTAALLASARAWHRRPRQALRAVALLFAPWATGLLANGYAWTQPAGPALKIAAVQGNVAQQLKWDPAYARSTLDHYRQLTAPHGDADLVVWPENAIALLREDVGPPLRAMDEAFKGRHQALITGIPVSQADGHGGQRFYNSLMVIGAGTGTYFKQKLVPFGEYVPLQQYLRAVMGLFDLPMSNFSPGPPRQPPLLAKGITVAPLICYEGVFPQLSAEQASHGQLIVTVSNDTWFGRSIGPAQHLQIARMRALESGRWMVRATNSGITVLVDPLGHVQARLASFQSGVLRGDVVPMTGSPPYLRWRLWPLGSGCALVLALAAVLGRSSRRRHRHAVMLQ